MRRVGFLRLAGVVGVVMLLPCSAAAQERLRSDGRVTRTPPNQVFIHPTHPRPVHPAFLPRHRAPFLALPYSSALYTPPPIAYDQPSYLLAPPAPAMPVPSVVEYPNGRYELWGDGLTTPFRWVWIPKPPPGPPEEPPAVSPPAEPPEPAKPSAERAPAPPRAIYRWTDEEGVTHWTDQLENIPERYRSKARTPILAGK